MIFARSTFCNNVGMTNFTSDDMISYITTHCFLFCLFLSPFYLENTK